MVLQGKRFFRRWNADAHLQLSHCGCRACCADRRQRRAQQLPKAEGQLHCIEAESPNARHLCAEVCSSAAGPLQKPQE